MKLGPGAGELGSLVIAGIAALTLILLLLDAALG